MPDELDRQAIIDEEHLKLLRWGYLVSGGMAGLFSLFALLYVLMGIIILFAAPQMTGNSSRPGAPPPAFVGWIITGIGTALFLVIVTVAILKLYTARYIRCCRSRVFCMVIAGLSCLEFPYGTFLGVLTFMVLGRESVVRRFPASQ
jgi:hypothetical protein